MSTADLPPSISTLLPTGAVYRVPLLINRFDRCRMLWASKCGRCLAVVATVTAEIMLCSNRDAEDLQLAACLRHVRFCPLKVIQEKKPAMPKAQMTVEELGRLTKRNDRLRRRGAPSRGRRAWVALIVNHAGYMRRRGYPNRSREMLTCAAFREAMRSLPRLP